MESWKTPVHGFNEDAEAGSEGEVDTADPLCASARQSRLPPAPLLSTATQERDEPAAPGRADVLASPKRGHVNKTQTSLPHCVISFKPSFCI